MCTRSHRQFCIRSFLPALLLVVSSALSGEEPKRHPLWRVQSGEHTMYLLGSIHALGSGEYPLPGELTASFDKADVAVFEISLDSSSEVMAQRLILETGRYPRGRTLRQSVSDSAYRLAAERFRIAGWNIRTLDSFKPWMVAITLLGLELQRLGLSPASGVDRFFFNRARGSGKKVEFLETPEFQVGLMNGFSEKVQEAFLLSSAREANRMRNDIRALVRAWREGNGSLLDSLLNEDADDFPEVFQKMLYERNNDWLRHIEGYLQGSATYIVVVGAAHLVGPQGVVELLRKKGYLVSQM